MAKATLHIILAAIGAAAASIAYFITLLLGLPVYVAVLLFGLFCFIVFRSKAFTCLSDGLADTPLDYRGLLLLAVGLTVLVCKAYSLEDKYGYWDAWWFWNPRANFLTRPDEWKLAFSGNKYGTVFTVPVAHSDYPPFLPLLNAFCWRLMHMQPAVVPFMWSLFSFLLLPAVLFLEVYGRNKVIGALSLFYFITQDHFIQMGCGQIADGWVGLFTLLAFVCNRHYRESGQRAYLFLTGALLGCCLWTKNEGIVIAAVFFLFTVGKAIRQGAATTLMAGLALPLLALLFFKIFLAPENDILSVQQGIPWSNITNPGRYGAVISLVWDMIETFFPTLPYLLGCYAVFLLLEKKAPDPEMAIIFTCFLCYLGGYLISPHNLGWHINTSADRLIFQLLPASIWIIGMRLSRIRISIAHQG